MMIPSLALMLLRPQEPTLPPTVPAQLVGASMFKNGFAITRRVVAVARPGTTIVMPIPSGALGTLWFTPEEGMELDSITVENDVVPSKGTLNASSIEEVLGLNVGGVVTLVIAEKEGAPSRLSGKLVNANGSVVVVETGETTRAIPKTTVLSLEGKGLKWSSPYETATTRRVMRIRTTGKAGRIGVVALERGLSWMPSYAVNLLPDGKTLNLVAKATVINDLEPLKDLECRFVTGFPNLPFAYTLDPLVEGSPLGPGGPGGGFGGAGGFGGGGFGGQGAAPFQNTEARRNANVGVRDDDAKAFAAAQDGEALGELFFYPRNGITLGQQGRGAYTLFALKVSYETVYAMDLTDPAPGQPVFEARIPPPGSPTTEEVWQTLRFTNSARLPLTTAPATTFQKEEILGQDTLKYVSPGQTAELRVTRTLDVSTDFTEEETGRERGFIKGRNSDGEYPIYDRVTAKGTITLVNRKAVAIKMRIRKPYTGTWLTADGTPKVTAAVAALRLPNPTGVAEWTPTIPAGGTLKLTYSVQLLVRS